jgi:hypothetical protein
VIFTSIRPESISSLNGIVVKKKGNLSTAQNLKDPVLNEFIFITRPNFALSIAPPLSEASKRAIRKSYEKNIEKAEDNMATHANISDAFLRSTYSEPQAEAEKKE